MNMLKEMSERGPLFIFGKEEISSSRTNGLVGRSLDSQYNDPMFKITGRLQGQLNLSSF